MFSPDMYPVTKEYLEYYSSSLGLNHFLAEGNQFAHVRDEVSNIWHLYRNSQDGAMLGLRGFMFLLNMPAEEVKEMGFTWEFNNQSMNAMFLMLALHFDGTQIRSCMNEDHKQDLGVVMNTKSNDMDVLASMYRSNVYRTISNGIFNNPEIRYIFQDIYQYSKPVPPLFILGHGGGNPKTIYDKDKVLTEEKIDTVLQSVSPQEFCAVVDCTCNTEYYVPNPGNVPYFGVHGPLNIRNVLPSFVVMPDGTIHGSYKVSL